MNITAAWAVDREFFDIVSPLGYHGTPLACKWLPHGFQMGPNGTPWAPVGPQWIAHGWAAHGHPLGLHGLPVAYHGRPMGPPTSWHSFGEAMFKKHTFLLQDLRFWNLPTDRTGRGGPRKCWHEVLLGAPLPQALGVRMTVATLTPSTYIAVLFDDIIILLYYPIILITAA